MKWFCIVHKNVNRKDWPNFAYASSFFKTSSALFNSTRTMQRKPNTKDNQRVPLNNNVRMVEMNGNVVFNMLRRAIPILFEYELRCSSIFKPRLQTSAPLEGIELLINRAYGWWEQPLRLLPLRYTILVLFRPQSSRDVNGGRACTVKVEVRIPRGWNCTCQGGGKYLAVAL